MKKLKIKTYDAVLYSIEHPELSITKVGEICGVDRHQITKYKKDNLYLQYKYKNLSNLEDDSYYYFTEEDLKYVHLHLDNPSVSWYKLREQYPNFPERQTLYRWCNILGFQPITGQKLKYHYNRNKFQTIQTEEDAYWLGFFTADGCIIQQNERKDGSGGTSYVARLALAERDRDHIEKFCRYLEYPEDEIPLVIKKSYGGAYTHDNPIAYVGVCSQQIVFNLQDKGIDFRKSGQEKVYHCSSVELEKAYVRGLIDGDGYFRKNGQGCGLVGSYEICSYVKEFLNRYVVDISGTTIKQDGKIHRLAIGGKSKSQKIARFLYGQANIYLDRKYQIYLKQYK